MNLMYGALIFLAYQLLKGKKDNNSENSGEKGGSNSSGSPFGDMSVLGSLLNDDTKTIIDSVGKFGDKNASNEEKMSAMFQMMTNPTTMDIASSFFGGKKSSDNQTSSSDSNSSSSGDYQEPDFYKQYENGNTPEPESEVIDMDNNVYTNDEGYTYKDIPSSSAVEFFKPIENIADVDAKHKLYEVYDNWYAR